jgi:4-hydroxybenzoate polyprenyltransferase
MTDWIRLLRPSRWIKNFLVFSAPLFAGALSSTENLRYLIFVFFVFSFIASSLYVLNDWLDREQDRAHPTKKERPIASGAISGTQAFMASILLLGLCCLFIGLFPVDRRIPVAGVIGAYLLIMIGYNFGLKQVPILDMILIALGLVLRALAGAVVVDVAVTGWFMVTIIFVSLLLVAGKRRHELLSMEGSEAAEHRSVLGQYNRFFLDQVISLMAGASLVTYVLYTLEGGSPVLPPGNWLALSVIFVVFGILRYLLLIYSDDQGEQPEQVFLEDGPLLISIVLWTIYIICLIRV